MENTATALNFDAIDQAWTTGNDAGKGYAVGYEDDEDINAIEGLGDLVRPSTGPDTLAIYVDTHEIIAVGDVEGPWAVSIDRDA